MRLTVNGKAQNYEDDPDMPLLWYLRDDLQLTGTRFGCGSGQCGACFVLVDGHAVTACDTPLWSVAGKDVTTIEGLGTVEAPHPLQAAFIAEQAMQCGYCVPGIIISGYPENRETMAALADVIVLAKPFTQEQMGRAIREGRAQKSPSRTR